MQKNKKNGFLFFDLLVALMIVMTFITLVLATISFITYCYTTHKEYLFAKDVMSDLLYRINCGEKLPSKSSKRVGETEFTITVDQEKIGHVLVGAIDAMPLVIVTVSWVNCRKGTERIALKTLDVSGRLET